MLDFNALAQLNQRLETQLALKNIKDPQLKAYFKTGKVLTLEHRSASTAPRT